MTTVQTTTVTILLKGRSIRTTFLALPDTPNAKTLLGIDFLHDTGLVIDYKHGQWHFHGDRHRCYGFISKDHISNQHREGKPSCDHEDRTTTLAIPPSPD